MFVFSRLRSILHNARTTRVAPAAELPSNVRALPAMGRARVPLKNMPRVWEVDEPTKVLVWPGTPGVNDGAAYVRPEGVIGRHRSPDANAVPARFARQRVA